MQNLNPKACAIACGSVCAIGIVLLALLAMFSQQYGDTVVSIISNVYIGYRPSVPGALIGALWAFADGAICGWIFATIYNKFAR